VGDTIRDGLALVGTKPRVKTGRLMAPAEQRNHARSFLKKAEEYLGPPRTTSKSALTARQPETSDRVDEQGQGATKELARACQAHSSHE